MGKINSVLAVDPGTTVSAWVHYLLDEDRVTGFATCDNGELLDLFKAWSLSATRTVKFGEKSSCVLVVEEVTSYGKPVGASTFSTCLWTGRFIQAWGGSFVLYPRRRVKKVLLGKDKGGDPQVREAVLSWFGGKALAVGSKACKGDLWGMKGHDWQACGIALAYARELRSNVAPPAVEP